MDETLDRLIRHQIYVEGFKNHESAEAESMVEETIAAIALLLLKLGVEKLSDLSRRDYLQFLRAVDKEVKSRFGTYAARVQATLRKFFAADLDITGALLGTEYQNSADRLFGSINNAAIAGVGTEPTALLNGSGEAMAAQVGQAVKRGFADNLGIAAIAAALVGTAAYRFRDGEAAKIKRQLTASLDTIIQHFTTEIQFGVGRLVSDRYRWCSVLDSRTTDICRERHGKMFYYGDGPRPPAHYRCRSFTQPVTATMSLDDLPTFYSWVKGQPAAIQDDVLGPTRGRDLRKGVLGSGDLPGFDRARPLTVEQYAAKLPQMLGKVA